MNKKYKRLSPNFHESEFACKCCGELGDKKQLRMLVNKLEILRAKFNKPIVVLSGYRCPKHNEKVGGAKKSQHMNSMAADIKIKGMSTHRIAKAAGGLFKAIGIYDTFVHVDIRSWKAFWDHRTKKENKNDSDKKDTKPSTEKPVRKKRKNTTTSKSNSKTGSSKSKTKEVDANVEGK